MMSFSFSSESVTQPVPFEVAMMRDYFACQRRKRDGKAD